MNIQIAYPYVLLIAVNHNNHVLLLRRNEHAPFGACHYSLVGGKVEDTESYRQALIREAREEVGIVIEEKDLSFSSIIHAYRPHERIVLATFTVKVWRNNPLNCEPHKHDALLWAPLQRLPDPLLPLNRL